MTPAWRRSIASGKRRSRPTRLGVELSLGPVLKGRLLDEAEAMRIHPNQLVSQIVEVWLVGRKGTR
jgi:hypothetical protein